MYKSHVEDRSNIPKGCNADVISEDVEDRSIYT